MKTFVLYSTEHCHLCELAEQVLVQTLDVTKHQVEVEDIANNDQDFFEDSGPLVPS